MLLSCVAKIGAALLALPLPIIGAALVFEGASMPVGRVQIVRSLPITMRNTFIIGVSLLFALSRRVYPELFALLLSFLLIRFYRSQWRYACRSIWFFLSGSAAPTS